jgi:hypothetical protein
MTDVHIDHIRGSVVVVAPNALPNEGAAEGAASISQELFQQGIFFCGQFNLPLASFGYVGDGIQL